MKRLLLMVIFLSLLSSAEAQNLTVVTTTFKPYNMEEKGKITGIGTEIVQATLEKAGIKAEIQIFPWARAYKMASEEQNTLIYTMIKIPEREPLFKWVGPIVPPIRGVLHKLKKRKDIVVNSLADAKKYKIGSVRDIAPSVFLKKEGFEEGKHLDLASENKQSIQKLFAERVDLEASAELNFLYEVKQMGLAYSDIEIAFVLFENEGYIAFSKQTSDELIERVKKAFEQIKAAGTADVILNKYLK
jgi:polar amino acid transport system substrate-binding protein